MPEGVNDQIRSILLSDWDPHNAASTPAAHHTYDTYIPPLLDLIRSGADEDTVVTWLHGREKESMCFPSLGTQRLRRVAKKLLHLQLASRPRRA